MTTTIPRRLYDRANADASVIAASPLVCGAMEVPHRVVLRDLGREYVVHTQAVSAEGDGPADFHGGHYFPKSTPGALRAAFARFVECAERVLEG